MGTTHYLRASCLALALGSTWPLQVLGQVKVTGKGAVGIGVMQRGTINVYGLTPQEAKALATATGQALVKQMEAIAKRINAKPGAEAVPVEVVHSFLAITKGKHVPVADWPATFEELTERFRRTGTQIAAIPVTDGTAKALVAQADAARRRGAFDDAERLLKRANDLALQAEHASKAERESTRKEAEALATRASTAIARFEYAEGAKLFEHAFDLRQREGFYSVFAWLIQAGLAWEVQGDSAQALRVFIKAREVARAVKPLLLSHRARMYAQAASHGAVGRAQHALGDMGSALESYRISIAIARGVAASDRDIALWQWLLSISLLGIGDVQYALGELGVALTNYQAGVEIAQKLVASDPDYSQWGPDWSLSYNKIGDMQRAQGDLGAALKSYQAGMVIAQKLADSHQSSTLWQWQLSVSHLGIGDVQYALGEIGAALTSYQAGMGPLRSWRHRTQPSPSGNLI